MLYTLLWHCAQCRQRGSRCNQFFHIITFELFGDDCRTALALSRSSKSKIRYTGRV